MTATKSIPVLLLIVIVASLTTIAPFSIDTYLPSFPSIAFDLNATAAQMQQSMSYYMAGFALATLFCGSISDALGRKPVVIIALIAYAITSLACANVDTIDSFLSLRFLQGMTAAVGIVVGRAMVRDLYHGAEAQKVMSYAMLFFAAAPGLAPIIGGFLEVHFGWHSVFVFLMLLALLILLMVLLRLPETLPVDQRHSMHPVTLSRNYLHAITHKRFTLIGMMLSLNFAGFFIYVTASPRIIFTHLGFSAKDFYIMFIPMVGGIMLGSLLSGKLSDKLKPVTMVVLGASVMLLAAIINVLQSMLLPVMATTVIAPLVLYAVGVAFTLPVITVMGIDQLPEHRGLAASLQSFLQMGTNALVAGVVTPLVFNSIQHIAITMLIFNLLALGCFGWIMHDMRKSASKSDRQPA